MNLNLHTWFGERELDFCPTHFVRCTATVTSERIEWIYEKLNGRFFISENAFDFLLEDKRHIYFEDPQEAVFYDLTWS